MREARTAERSKGPIPRDREDQQAEAGEDPLAITVPVEAREPAKGAGGRREAKPAEKAEKAEKAGRRAEPGETGDAGGPDGELPDTDEAGTGPAGRTRRGTVHPEHPAPGEPTD
ncbi:hypothetical protein ACF09E_01070 [Streptomyces sp. NPDC014891]|uniref:hypothetical protein n=1 Tax=Streptomyces sp. NPDC014891 TaxID=3364929 RepID=UPI0036FDC66B